VYLQSLRSNSEVILDLNYAAEKIMVYNKKIACLFIASC
jgi:hypothetical protein